VERLPGEDLINVELNPKQEPLIINFHGLPVTLAKRSMDIFTYLKEAYKVQSEDLPLLIEFGNCWKIYRGTMNQLIDKVKKELDRIYRSRLLEALEEIDSIDPTPGYPTRFLVYEIMNHKKYKQAEERKDYEDYTWMDRFDKEDMKILADTVKTYRQRCFIGLKSFPESYQSLLWKFYRLGILKLGGNLEQPVYHVNEDDLNNSTLVVWNNRSHFSHEEIQILNDLKKLKE